MMQIIHDVAPGASLAFHTAFAGIADFAAGIEDLAKSAGAQIITDDVIYFSEPMFQDGPIAQAVDTVKAMGVAYFSAAGNQARSSYEAPFRDSGLPGHYPGSTSHDFDPGSGVDVLQKVTIPVGSTVTFVLQWDEPFASVSGPPGSASDVDMLLYSQSGKLLAGGIAYNVGGDPIEIFTYRNPGPSTSFQIGLELSSGPAPDRVKYVYYGNMTINDFPTQSATIYGHANAAGAMAVGAARYSKTPAFGVSPPVRESYSSVGGVPILLDASGNSTYDLRQKPEIVAPDGGDTTFFGSDVDHDGYPNFFGTSAAAPHAAAVAALMKQADPDLTPDDIYTGLQASTIDMDTAGVDFFSGYGLIQADQVLTLVATDTDGDTVPDYIDNCTLVPNSDQRDTDGDGYGNI